VTLAVRILGAGAGGGLPQWNCGCDNCRAARAGEIPSRTQSSIAVSADGERWLLVNASPDVRQQVQGVAAKQGRGSGIAAIAITSADVDHVAGLLVLREGGAPPLYATREAAEALTSGLSVLPALAAYGPVDVRSLEPSRSVSFADRTGRPLGIEADVVDLDGKPPLYVRARAKTQEEAGPGPGHAIALVLRAGAARVVYAPGVSSIGPELSRHLAAASVILIDGTCFTDDELAPLGGRTARDMGHMTVGGPDGTLSHLARYPKALRIFVHINNTNPMLRPGSPERLEVEAAGVDVGEDGALVLVDEPSS
jgi:pyrroloquinoline quinone biosynthesis protein B